jgi:hypothetical protein
MYEIHELPLTNAENFKNFVEIIGAENLEWLFLTEITVNGQIKYTGTYLLNENGFNRGKDYYVSSNDSRKTNS